eukprot:1989729-Rhodomonas_salina.2
MSAGSRPAAKDQKHSSLMAVTHVAPDHAVERLSLVDLIPAALRPLKLGKDTSAQVEGGG